MNLWSPANILPPRDDECILSATQMTSVPVLAICKDGTQFVGYCFSSDIHDLKCCTWYIYTAMGSTKKVTKKVTHWMLLPEPPEVTV